MTAQTLIKHIANNLGWVKIANTNFNYGPCYLIKKTDTFHHLFTFKKSGEIVYFQYTLSTESDQRLIELNQPIRLLTQSAYANPRGGGGLLLVTMTSSENQSYIESDIQGILQAELKDFIKINTLSDLETFLRTSESSIYFMKKRIKNIFTKYSWDFE